MTQCRHILPFNFQYILPKFHNFFYNFLNVFGRVWNHFCTISPNNGGTRWRSWLRHCATSRKVAVSIPDSVTGICHWP